MTPQWWEQAAAMAMVMTAIGGFVVFLVRSIVRDSISKAINGFDRRMALMEQQFEIDHANFNALHDYSHKEWRDQIAKFADAQLEAFRAGQRSRGRE